MANIVQEIPWEQKTIISTCLKRMLSNIEEIEILNTQSQELDHLKFDLNMLQKLLKYKINVELTQQEFDNFTATNQVDFPQYIIDKKL